MGGEWVGVGASAAVWVPPYALQFGHGGGGVGVSLCPVSLPQGHRISDFDLDVLVHRMQSNKVPNWSRISRLKRTAHIKVAHTHTHTHHTHTHTHTTHTHHTHTHTHTPHTPTHPKHHTHRTHTHTHTLYSCVLTCPPHLLALPVQGHMSAQQIACGRLVCDTNISSKELIRARSYDLTSEDYGEDGKGGVGREWRGEGVCTYVTLTRFPAHSHRIQ